MLKTNIDRFINQVTRLPDFVGAKAKHFVEKYKEVKINAPKINLSMSASREVWKKTSRGILDCNININQYSQHIKKLAEGSAAGQRLLKLSQHKWFRKSVVGVAIAVGATMLEKSLNGFNPKPAIPKDYERGYDIMNETMTDFGSPVKLVKTASKIITPYYSSVRRGVVTTTKAVTNKNLSLVLSSKAIGHARY